MLRSRTRLRVRYAETDQMGVLYYANYLVWMEVARVELSRQTKRKRRRQKLTILYWQPR